MELAAAPAIVSGVIESNLIVRSGIGNHSSIVWFWLSSCGVCFSSRFSVFLSDDSDTEELKDLNEDSELLFTPGLLCFVPKQMIFVQFNWHLSYLVFFHESGMKLSASLGFFLFFFWVHLFAPQTKTTIIDSSKKRVQCSKAKD